METSVSDYERSVWSSDSSEEEPFSEISTSVHRKIHFLATPIMAELFEAIQIHPQDHSKIYMLRQKLEALNEEIRRESYISRSGSDAERGVIDIDIFIFAWNEDRDNQDLRRHAQLEGFCKFRNYPLAWARYPPGGSPDYQPFTERYWEKCDWYAAGLLLDSIWKLRKAGSESILVEELEVLLIEFEYRFNDRISGLHKKNKNHGCKAFLLGADDLLEGYRVLAECLDSEDQQARGTYDQARRELRNLCALRGYPPKWVPGTFQEERNL